MWYNIERQKKGLKDVFAHVSKRRHVVRRHGKKERPGIFFFQKKTTRQVTFFFYILPNWFKYKKAIVVIYAHNDLHPSSGQRYTETKNL